VKIGSSAHRISRASAQFFLDWVRERMSQVQLADPREQEEVVAFHRRAEQFWRERMAQGNAP
jgi:hypothetical protein